MASEQLKKSFLRPSQRMGQCRRPLVLLASVDKHAKRGVHLSGLNDRRNGPPRPIVFTSRCCEANGRLTMKKSLFALLLLAFTADFLVQFPARLFAGPAEEVQVAMQLLKSKAATLGAPIVNGMRQSPARLSPPYILARPR